MMLNNMARRTKVQKFEINKYRRKIARTVIKICLRGFISKSDKLSNSLYQEISNFDYLT